MIKNGEKEIKYFYDTKKLNEIIEFMKSFRFYGLHIEYATQEDLNEFVDNINLLVNIVNSFLSSITMNTQISQLKNQGFASTTPISDSDYINSLIKDIDSHLNSIVLSEQKSILENSDGDDYEYGLEYIPSFVEDMLHIFSSIKLTSSNGVMSEKIYHNFLRFLSQNFKKIRDLLPQLNQLKSRK